MCSDDIIFLLRVGLLLCLASSPITGEMNETDWFLCAHGSTRSLATPGTAEWTARLPYGGYHIPYWAVPFDEGPNLAGGVNQRASDGHIHLPLLGPVPYNGNPDWPSGGSLKHWSPAVVWEIDGDTGKTVQIYNLSDYADCYNSVLRYTADGYPVVAGYSHSGSSILVLDKESSNVAGHYSPGGVEPQLLQVSLTNPPQLLWADINADGAANVSGHTLETKTELSTLALSSIICGADGLTVYNNGFFNHDTGIFRFSLPLTSSSKDNLFISDCLTKPWVMATDSQGRIYALCRSENQIHAWDKTGQHMWSVPGTCLWLSLSDDETAVLLGNANNWEAVDTSTGKVLWQTSASEAFGDGVQCSFSAQPWAPRHPIPFRDGTVAFLCSQNGASKVFLLSVKTGEAEQTSVAFDFVPEMLTADSAKNMYAYGTVNEVITVQKKSFHKTD